MNKYLRPTDVMDYNHPEVQDLARTLGDRISEQTIIAKRCFEWVRDEIKHSGDFKMNPTTCAASEVLRYKTGLVFCQESSVGCALKGKSYTRWTMLPTAHTKRKDDPLHTTRFECSSAARIWVVQNRSKR